MCVKVLNTNVLRHLNARYLVVPDTHPGGDVAVVHAPERGAVVLDAHLLRCCRCKRGLVSGERHARGNGRVLAGGVVCQRSPSAPNVQVRLALGQLQLPAKR